MVTKEITIKIPTGLEGGPVALLVQVACQFNSSIKISCDNKYANAKSIMGVMALGLAAGDTVTVTAEGSDEVQAIDNIEKYLCSDAD